MIEKERMIMIIVNDCVPGIVLLPDTNENRQLIADHYAEYGTSRTEAGFPATDKLEKMLDPLLDRGHIYKMYESEGPIAIITMEW